MASYFEKQRLMDSTRFAPSADNGVSDMFRIVLSREEVLALDQYFTWRVGYIGHEDPADQTAHKLADLIAAKAKELQTSANDSNRQSDSE